MLKNLSLKNLLNTVATCHAVDDIVSATDLDVQGSVRLIIKDCAGSDEACGFLNRVSKHLATLSVALESPDGYSLWLLASLRVLPRLN